MQVMGEAVAGADQVQGPRHAAQASCQPEGSRPFACTAARTASALAGLTGPLRAQPAALSDMLSASAAIGQHLRTPAA